MNQHVPDWTTEGESGCLTDLLPMTNQKNSMGQDDELMELLWRDGHVIMHSQTHRRTPSDVTEFRPTQKLDQSLGNSSNLIQEAETSSWFQYTLDDSFEKEFCSEFFSEFANTDTVVSDNISKDLVTEEDRHFKFGSSNESNSFTGITASTSNQCTGTLQESTMPLPRSHLVSSTPQSCLQNRSGVRNFPHFSRSLKADLRFLRSQLGSKASGSDQKAGAQESSMMTVGSSACESNQIQCHTDASNTLSIDAAGVVAGVKEDTGVRLLLDRRQSKAHEVTVTSSSGGSDCSYGRVRQQNASYQNHKRKERDIEDSGFQSEEADFESNEEKKPAERLISKRRSRAAEVHNLSERRRRDRINEKMKALQELIPHCNKTDKASMLDEAIEYLKSLQLQVQMMWMGSGMAPMMFPGLQQYVSGIGMGHTSMPAIHSALQLPRVPYVNQSVASTSSANQTSLFPSSATNVVNFPNQMQMQTIHLPESHARYPGLHMMQPNQAANFSTYGSHMVQQNQAAVTPSSSPLPSAGGPTSSRIRNNKSGTI